MLHPRFSPILAHAGFVLWLFAFPFEGLLVASVDPLPSLFFLLPHAFALLCLIRVHKYSWFQKFTDHCVFLTLTITLFFPYFQNWGHALLALTGVFSAVLPVRLGLLHASTSRPFLSAALGQSFGIGLLFTIPALPLPIQAQFILIALPLLLFRGKSPSPHPANIVDSKERLIRALPIIFLFFMTSGLTHGLLLPLYLVTGLLPGLELLFYVACVIIGFRLAEFRIHLPLALAIVLAVFAFGIWQSPDRAAIDISMYSMNSSKGFADIFLLSLMLGQRDVARSFALGVGLMVLGMAGGIYLAHALGHEAWAFVLVGNILVCTTVLVFFIQGPKKVLFATVGNSAPLTSPTTSLLMPKAVSKTVDDPETSDSHPFSPDTFPMNVPASPPLNEPYFMQTLSQQERNVLDLVLEGSNYKQAAKHLGITESSVKTYMSRIFAKADVKNRSSLLKKHFNNQ